MWTKPSDEIYRAPRLLRLEAIALIFSISIRSLSELLGSAFDWRSIRISSRHLWVMSTSPLTQSAKKMKEVMEGRGPSYGTSQSQRVLEYAAQDSADGCVLLCKEHQKHVRKKYRGRNVYISAWVLELPDMFARSGPCLSFLGAQ